MTSTQLTGGQWIGPAVRMQNGGQDMYLGIYFWNNGTPQLRIYKRSAGTWIQLGSSYNCGPLAAGTLLQLTAVGSTISFLQNGVDTDHCHRHHHHRRSARDHDLRHRRRPTTGRAAPRPPPALPNFQIHLHRHRRQRRRSYNVVSADDGYGTQVMRVLAPRIPRRAYPQLPLRPPGRGRAGTLYGDGMDTLRALDAQDQYNLTIIEPSFAIEPWYADNPERSDLHFETFMTKISCPG